MRPRITFDRFLNFKSSRRMRSGDSLWLSGRVDGTVAGRAAAAAVVVVALAASGEAAAMTRAALVVWYSVLNPSLMGGGFRRPKF